MQKSNILYLTNACNFKCDYCYQQHDSEILRLTEADIHNFINEIIEREGSEVVSTVVLFGGEPLLLKYKFFWILDIFESYWPKRFALSTTTNGSLFADTAFLEAFKDKIQNLKNSFQLEISWDGKGQYRRVYADGSPSADVLPTILSQFEAKSLAIRYTIHSGNYNCAIHDIISLQKYKKIIVNFYETELEAYIDVKAYKSKLIRITEYLYTKFKTPICFLNCRLCQSCEFGKFEGINYNGLLSVDGNAGEFNHFSKLKDLK